LKLIRALTRFIILSVWTLLVSFIIFLLLCIAFLIGRKDKTQRKLAHFFFNLYIRGVHFLAGIKITSYGEGPKDPHVIMGNHRSYVDSVVIPVSFPVVFVAKHETKSWPIVGWGATVIGTIWVKRDKKESRRATREAVKDRLSNGYGVAIFPEGTTHIGPELLPYHKGIFYTCAENGFPIVPAAIEYENPNIAWVGKEMFIPHALRHFGARKINVHVSFGPSMSNSDAEKLREDARNWTQDECLRLRAIIDGNI
jgi:1-acyl-sn-glycerol-3-phosphate acyltransferase